MQPTSSGNGLSSRGQVHHRRGRHVHTSLKARSGGDVGVFEVHRKTRSSLCGDHVENRILFSLIFYRDDPAARRRHVRLALQEGP